MTDEKKKSPTAQLQDDVKSLRADLARFGEDLDAHKQLLQSLKQEIDDLDIESVSEQISEFQKKLDAQQASQEAHGVCTFDDTVGD